MTEDVFLNEQIMEANAVQPEPQPGGGADFSVQGFIWLELPGAAPLGVLPSFNGGSDHPLPTD
ncbi:MAG: hypothetical protein HY420_01755 [Candidatus Kerfeldbacteria bacterium]|nr:hypothetical protein [Candidatus Kerfeldbacteria bacterium]